MKYDIRNDPRFLKRAEKIEEKAYIKRLKEPVEMVIGNNLNVIVAAIGINGSYLAAIPGMNKDGTWIMGGLSFGVWWTDKKSSAFSMTEVAKLMLEWALLADDADYENITHRNFNHVQTAIDVIVQCRGVDYFENGKATITITDQGVERDIPNPFYTKGRF